MASYPNKLIAQVAFKAGGDVFHQLVANNPRHLTNATPGKIQECKLHQGDYGVNGSVIEWSYTVDGKAQTAKQVLQDIDKEKKQIAWKMLEGDLCELYKNMLITVHVETKDGVDFITWTIDYELIALDNPHPLSLLNFFICLTKEMESHIFG
ncbi:MLP-like protein 28 [Salvia miltiorrhiza]|uniref:MLP-like protein 28 n=1 Tax=Salvia miltiorrhiza TaxID=226208 RepID=UPI0025AD8347|nr:MLP-like protein 28 [Salvia miltiorrhiza]